MAVSAEKQRKGLMFVTDLDEGKGMLFIYELPQKVSFWMKNTFVSLDIVMMNERFEIVRMYRKCVPFSLEHMPSVVPVSFVLELKAGAIEQFGFLIGEKLRLGVDEV